MEKTSHCFELSKPPSNPLSALGVLSSQRSLSKTVSVGGVRIILCFVLLIVCCFFFSVFHMYCNTITRHWFLFSSSSSCSIVCIFRLSYFHSFQHTNFASVFVCSWYTRVSALSAPGFTLTITLPAGAEFSSMQQICPDTAASSSTSY